MKASKPIAARRIESGKVDEQADDQHHDIIFSGTIFVSRSLRSVCFGVPLAGSKKEVPDKGLQGAVDGTKTLGAGLVVVGEVDQRF